MITLCVVVAESLGVARQKFYGGRKSFGGVEDCFGVDKKGKCSVDGFMIVGMLESVDI